MILDASIDWFVRHWVDEIRAGLAGALPAGPVCAAAFEGVPDAPWDLAPGPLYLQLLSDRERDLRAGLALQEIWDPYASEWSGSGFGSWSVAPRDETYRARERGAAEALDARIDPAAWWDPSRAAIALIGRELASTGLATGISLTDDFIAYLVPHDSGELLANLTAAGTPAALERLRRQGLLELEET